MFNLASNFRRKICVALPLEGSKWVGNYIIFNTGKLGQKSENFPIRIFQLEFSN